MEALAKFDDRDAPVVMAAASIIPNGFYTLTLPDGGHRTFRIHTKRATSKFAPGKRVIGLLIGPDNTHDYEGFGFVTDEGIVVWKRLKGTATNPSRYDLYADVIWNVATGQPIEGYSLEVSKRCLVCNRVLTDPQSVERNIGPECWVRHGGSGK